MKKNYETKPTQAFINAPLKVRPTYALEEGATIEEMRDTSIRAMADELTIPWAPNQDFMYQKKSACARAYYFYSNTAYAGLPYTTGGSGFFQWYDMMDPETGILYDTDFAELGYEFGNSCAASVSWGAAAVCASAQCADSTYTFIPKNGWLPLGGVKLPEGLNSYREYGTDEAIADNGVDKVLAGYMAAKKGDAVVATANSDMGKRAANHCMMLIKEPVVVKNEDGTLNLEESKVIVQDQWSRNYDLPGEMQTLLTRGHTYKEQSFQKLLEDKYIALTTAEYLGERPYEKAKGWMEGGETLETLSEAKLWSNYRPAVLALTVTAEDGTVLYSKRERTSSVRAISYYREGYEVKNLMTEAFSEALKTAGKKTVTVTVIVASGDEITLKTYES